MLARGVLVAVLGLVSAAPAGATPAWLAPVDLSTAGQHASDPRVAVDPAGNATAVWSRSDGTHTIVQSAVRPVGGVWSAPVGLSATGQNAAAPEVAVNAAGDAVAVWEQHDGTHDRVQAAVRPAGGSWSAPVELSAAGQNASEPKAAVDPAGNAIAIWQRSNGTDPVVVQAAVRPANEPWQASVDLSAADQPVEGAEVAVDAAGNAIAIWQRSNGMSWVVQAAARAVGEAWQAPVDLSVAGAHAIDPQVAVNPAGDAIAVWRRFVGADIRAQAAARPAGGAWQAPVNVSAPGRSANEPEVAIDAAGDATTVWRSHNGMHLIVQAAVRAAGGAWQAPVDLSPVGRDASRPQVAVNGAGNAIVAWSRFNGTHLIVQTAVRAAGGAWSAPVDASAAGQHADEPHVAVDAAGNVVAVWRNISGTHHIVQAAGYDAVGPRLDGLSVPASGTAGETLSFAVSPFDVWSPLGATSWTFGDTQTATGATTSHTYTSAGTYTVEVSAADALGNATSETRTITIGAATTAPPTTPPTTPPVVAPPTPPLLTGLRLAPTSFRAAASGPTVKAAAVTTGTRVSYTLNVAARVQFTLQRAVPGRRAGRRCVKPTARNRGARRCTRYVRVRGGFARARPAGEDRFTFTGRVRGRALRPGRYRLVATPAIGKPARAAFRIVR